jgi:hypothetical protein
VVSEEGDPPVRPAVVQAMLAALDDPDPDRLDDALVLLADASPAELAAASRQHAVNYLDLLVDLGWLRRTKTVMDLDLRTLLALAAVMGEMSAWWPQPILQDRPLGDVLKVIPADVAERVMALLRRGGLLPSDDPELPGL